MAITSEYFFSVVVSWAAGRHTTSLTHYQLGSHRYVINTGATDALVQKHQAISIHSDLVSIALSKIQTILTVNKTRN